MQLGGVPFLVEAPFLEETAVVPGTAVVEMTRLLLQGSWLVAVTPLGTRTQGLCLRGIRPNRDSLCIARHHSSDNPHLRQVAEAGADMAHHRGQSHPRHLPKHRD